MFFVISKVAWFLVQPLIVILVLLALGLLAFGLQFLRTGIAFTAIGFALLAVVSLTPLGLLMMNVLEERFPSPEIGGEVTGIVVLGGSFDTVIARTRGEPELNDAADRITAAMSLARAHPLARVVFTGGSAGLLADDIAESIPARALFDSLGLEPERLILEERARNTYENAVFSKALAAPQPGETWLLVTSAYHMPRSIGCFRRAGFEVVAYPVDYSTPSGSAVWSPSSASIRNVEKVHFAIREYLGLLAYRLTDRTDALFPSPSA